MIMVKQRQNYFPRWHAQSLLPDQWWAEPCDLQENETFFPLLTSLVEEQAEKLGKGYDYFYSFCESVSKDIVDLRINEKIDNVEMSYFQFESALTPFQISINSGEFNRAHDWLVNGLADEVSSLKSRILPIERIIDFKECETSFVRSNFSLNFLSWVKIFYYYCRARSTLHVHASIIWNTVLDVLRDASMTKETTVEACIAVLDWAVSNELSQARPLTTTLEALFFTPDQSLANKARIAISLGCTGAHQYSSHPSKYWAAWALENAEAELRCHEPLQLATAMVDTREDWFALKPLVSAAIKYYRKVLLLDNRDPISGMRSLDQRSQIIGRLISLLAEWEFSQDVIDIFSEWYGVSPSIQERVFLLMPNHADGMGYLGTKMQLIKSADWRIQVERLYLVTNQSLGLLLTLQGRPGGSEAPAAPGQPNYALGEEFESQITSHYNFKTLPPKLFIEAGAMISFPNYPHPLQPLMRRDLGVTLPITSSLEPCQPDRPIRKVGLWYAGNDYYSEMEINSTRVIFERKGINCEIFSGDGKKPRDFIEFYKRDDFDILWVAGHGDYDHWDPHAATVLAGEECRVDIASLWRERSISERRRLLVLNICDGGVASVMGSLHRLGIAPMLASSGQATISHMWPVEPRLAGAFGLHLANALSTDLGFFSSFCEAMDAMRMPMQDLVESCYQIAPGDLAERLANFPVDNSNILYWGSPCFFQ